MKASAAPRVMPALALVVVLWLGAVAASAAASALPAAAADGVPTTTVATAAPGEVDRPTSLERPNSGHEPTHAGDRGGSLQLAVFALLVAGTAIIGTRVMLAARAAQRAKDQQLRKPYVNAK